MTLHKTVSIAAMTSFPFVLAALYAAQIGITNQMLSVVGVPTLVIFVILMGIGAGGMFGPMFAPTVNDRLMQGACTLVTVGCFSLPVIAAPLSAQVAISGGKSEGEAFFALFITILPLVFGPVLLDLAMGTDPFEKDKQVKKENRMKIVSVVGVALVAMTTTAGVSLFF